MMIILIKIAIILSCYILSAYATTDIIRLAKGSTVPVYDPNCYCPVCKSKLRLTDQIPIFAYLFNHGKCRYCKCKIEIWEIIFEAALLILFSVSDFILQFSLFSLIAIIAEYELIKLFFILFRGKKENHFVKNLIISLATNIPVFALVSLLYIMLYIVQNFTS